MLSLAFQDFACIRGPTASPCTLNRNIHLWWVHHHTIQDLPAMDKSPQAKDIIFFNTFLQVCCQYFWEDLVDIAIYVNRQKSLTPTTSYFLRMKAMDSDGSLRCGTPPCMPYDLSSGPPKRTCSFKGNLSGPRAVLPYSSKIAQFTSSSSNFFSSHSASCTPMLANLRLTKFCQSYSSLEQRSVISWLWKLFKL